MEFKVGDRVRVRDDLEIDVSYGELEIEGAMKMYRGKNAKITRITCAFNGIDCYKIDLDNELWYWTDEMLEPEGIPLQVLKNDSMEIPLKTRQILKTKEQLKIEELEERIKSLEEKVGKEITLEMSLGKPNIAVKDAKQMCKLKPLISNEPKLVAPTGIEPSLLSEDERVILRNVDEDFKWIIRNTHQLTITERKPRLEKHGWTVEGGRLADLPYRKLFKFIKFEDDEPYNIEELLKDVE